VEMVAVSHSFGIRFGFALRRIFSKEVSQFLRCHTFHHAFSVVLWAIKLYNGQEIIIQQAAISNTSHSS
jgi:hypothetical protein